MLIRFATLILFFAGILSVMPTDPLAAGDKDKTGDEPKKVKLTGTIKTGINAIGGETTGTIIQTKEGNFELDVPKDNKELRKAVDELNKKMAVVTGTLMEKKGLAVKLRKIVTVETVKEADAK